MSDPIGRFLAGQNAQPDDDAQKRGAISNFLRGGATGLSQSAISLAGLPGLVIPGEDLFERFEERASENVEEFFDPQGTSGTVGRVVGRGVGEGAQLLAGGAGIHVISALLAFFLAIKRPAGPSLK